MEQHIPPSPSDALEASAKTFAPELVLNREYVRMRGTYEQRRFFHNAAMHIKQTVMEKRRQLAQEYIERHTGGEFDVGTEIERTNGYADADFSQRGDVRALLREANEIVAEKASTATASKGSLLFHCILEERLSFIVSSFPVCSQPSVSSAYCQVFWLLAGDI